MKGIEQAFTTGDKLKKKYVKEKKFFDLKKDLEEIYVESTNFPRTIKTANSVLTSLFKEELKEMNPPLLPLVTHTKIRYYDWKLNPFGNCEYLNQYKKKG